MTEVESFAIVMVGKSCWYWRWRSCSFAGIEDRELVEAWKDRVVVACNGAKKETGVIVSY